MRFRKILCPIDFSPDAREAMRTAMALAGSEGQVLLLHIYLVPVMGPPEVPMEPLLIDAVISGAEQGVREWADAARDLGPARVESFCLQGNPWDGIVEFARAHDVDLVVMGTRGKTGLRHVLLGSVAERVLRHASCPVLVVRGEQP